MNQVYNDNYIAKLEQEITKYNCGVCTVEEIIYNIFNVDIYTPMQPIRPTILEYKDDSIIQAYFNACEEYELERGWYFGRYVRRDNLLYEFMYSCIKPKGDDAEESFYDTWCATMRNEKFISTPNCYIELYKKLRDL